jgi:hypothetical protein
VKSLAGVRRSATPASVGDRRRERDSNPRGLGRPLRFSSRSLVTPVVIVNVRCVFRFGVHLGIPSAGNRAWPRLTVSGRVSFGLKADEARLGRGLPALSRILRAEHCLIPDPGPRLSMLALDGSSDRQAKHDCTAKRVEDTFKEAPKPSAVSQEPEPAGGSEPCGRQRKEA